MSFTARVEHDSTVEVAGEFYGIIKYGALHEYQSRTAPTSTRTFILAGPIGSVELPVSAIHALSITVAFPLIAATLWAIRLGRRIRAPA